VFDTSAKTGHAIESISADAARVSTENAAWPHLGDWVKRRDK